MNYQRIFGSGPTGIIVTIVIWTAALQLEGLLVIPKIHMAVTFQWIMFGFFVIDATITILWSFWVLPPKKWGTFLVTKGPFHLVRHPLYSAFIWNGTGMVAMGFRSWVVLFSVILVNFFWTWHIRKEENYMLELFGEEYRRYMEKTGQFFPRFGKNDHKAL